MPLMTPEQYIASLRALKPEIYKFGRRIEDVTTAPDTKYTVRGVAELYRLAQDEQYKDTMTTYSDLVDGPINRYLSIMKTADDARVNTDVKRLAFQQTGTCTGSRCAGWSASNALWATTWEMDQQLGTDYHQRLRAWLKSAQERDISIAGALTDPKGNRTLPPSQQSDPDMNLRVVDVRDDGIVVRGAKVMIAGAAAAHEIFVVPGSGYREADRDYAVSFAVPIDAPGLVIVEARQPNDTRKAEEGFDKGTECGGISQGYLFFQDVFIPRERVFMCREHQFSAPAVVRFVLCERATMGGCVAGQGDVKLAAAALMAHCNGIGHRPLMDKFLEMVVDNETLYGVSIAASMMGRQHPSGAWLPDPLLANVSKINVARLPYRTSMTCQEICGGIGETGCMPSYADYIDEKVGPLVQKYLKAGSSAEARMRAARLAEFTTTGCGVPGCMHGGGSPEAAKLALRGLVDFNSYLELGKRLAGIEEDVAVKAGKT